MNLACLAQRFLLPLDPHRRTWPMSHLISTLLLWIPRRWIVHGVLRQAMVVTSLSLSQSGNTSCEPAAHWPQLDPPSRSYHGAHRNRRRDHRTGNALIPTRAKHSDRSLLRLLSDDERSSPSTRDGDTRISRQPFTVLGEDTRLQAGKSYRMVYVGFAAEVFVSVASER